MRIPIPIRIQLSQTMRIHADSDPKPSFVPHTVQERRSQGDGWLVVIDSGENYQKEPLSQGFFLMASGVGERERAGRSEYIFIFI
jgi:hypothetical protein